MKSKGILGIALALVLPLAAYAENVVVPLPTAAPTVAVTVQTNEYAIDLESYFSEDMEGNPIAQYDEDGNDVGSVNWEQYPCLNSEERARVPELLWRYQGGERPQENVLDKTENVVVGVYALDPEQYQGESVFVLIPGRELTDEELLEIIDGYARLGKTFDADGLSWRNCMRGGGIECTRGWAGDESERAGTIAELYRRQGLRPETPFTASPSDDGIGEAQLDENEYYGLENYRFYPARRMTDDELLQIQAGWLHREEGTGEQYLTNEQAARRELHRLLGAPLAMERGYEEFVNANQLSIYNADLPVYNAQFTVSESQWYNAIIDTTTGMLYTADAWLVFERYTYSDLRLDPFDERWLTLARGYVAEMRADDMAIAAVESYGEVSIQDGGYGARVLVTMEDGSTYQMDIMFQNEALFSVEYRVTAITLEQVEAVYADLYD